MTALHDILSDLMIDESIGVGDVTVRQICSDSRQVSEGSLFVAVRGTQTDGHRFMSQVVEQGAVAVVCEVMPEEIKEGVAYIRVPDSAEALGIMAHAFYGKPSNYLELVGITGTNGKTTTATLLYDLYMRLGFKVGLLSTVENKINGTVLPSTHTTPDPVALNRLLAEMVTAGCTYAFMEVSSHAIQQRRIAGLQFRGAIFTNITHDHLDYHGTFQHYIEAKKRLFDDLPKGSFALTNIDDKRGEVMVQNTKANIYKYSLRRLADFKAKIIDNSLTGLQLELDGHEFHARLIGEFNAYNLLAVYGAAVLLGSDKMEVMTILSGLTGAEGRFDYIVQPQKEIIGIVDYAHTPDALEKVLMTIEKLRKGNGHLITVVGCGGDRDRAKRPVMTKTACIYSHQVILTADNPRSEDPEAIIAEMETGIPPGAVKKVLSISNRLQAIRTACQMAQKGDIILVAGKGHEKYQEIKGVKHPFDDKKILQENLLS